MKKIAIIGAGGFGRELKMLIDQINEVEQQYEILGFYDDDKSLPKIINGVSFLGDIDTLLKRKDTISLGLGIGIPKVKNKIIERLKEVAFDFPVLIHPSVFIGKDKVFCGLCTQGRKHQFKQF